MLCNKETKVLVQGITGKEGRRHTKMMLEYGTRIVAGVTPGRGGQFVEGVPVFNTIREAQEKIGKIDASVIFVPALIKKKQPGGRGTRIIIRAAEQAILEAAAAEIPLVVCITEGIPVWGMARIKAELESRKTLLIGPNTPGIIKPGECKIGIQPGYIFKKGSVALLTRSGSLSFEVASQLQKEGMGISVAIGIGGDPIIGTDFVLFLKLLKDDPETEAVVIVGEIGGRFEQDAADYIVAVRYPKPVLAFIPGIHAPKGKRMGHAGAIIGSTQESAQVKLDYFEKRGVATCRDLLEIGKNTKDLLERFWRQRAGEGIHRLIKSRRSLPKSKTPLRKEGS